MQSSQPVSSWLPPKSVRLGYIAKDLEGYQHEQRLIQDIHELALNALVAMNSEAKEVLMSRDVSASIAKIGQLAVDRTFNHRTLLYVCCQIFVLFSCSALTVCGAVVFVVLRMFPCPHFDRAPAVPGTHRRPSLPRHCFLLKKPF